jgi:hypothetical protein
MAAPIAAYFAAKSTDDIDAMLAPFSADAVVRDVDGNQQMHGLQQIRGWMDETVRKYRYTVEVLDVEDGGEATIVRCRLAGSFPGSPVDLRYAFRVSEGKIASLDIL